MVPLRIVAGINMAYEVTLDGPELMWRAVIFQFHFEEALPVGTLRYMHLWKKCKGI